MSEELASREAFQWCNLIAYMRRKPVAWVYATERGTSGLWHAHALVTGVGGLPPECPTTIWQERNGRADIARVYDQPGVTLYATKAAALGGEIIFADTLPHYREHLGTEVSVPLFPVGSVVGPQNTITGVEGKDIG